MSSTFSAIFTPFFVSRGGLRPAAGRRGQKKGGVAKCTAPRKLCKHTCTILFDCTRKGLQDRPFHTIPARSAAASSSFLLVVPFCNRPIVFLLTATTPFPYNSRAATKVVVWVNTPSRIKN